MPSGSLTVGCKATPKECFRRLSWASLEEHVVPAGVLLQSAYTHPQCICGPQKEGATNSLDKHRRHAISRPRGTCRKCFCIAGTRARAQTQRAVPLQVQIYRPTLGMHVQTLKRAHVLASVRVWKLDGTQAALSGAVADLQLAH